MIHTQALRESHRRLSPHMEALIDSCLADPSAISLIDPKTLQGIAKTYDYNAWPYLADQAFQNEVAAAAEAVLRLLHDLPRRIFGNDAAAFADMFQIPSRDLAAAVLEGPTAMDAIMARPDFLLTSDGFKCLETNVSPRIGGMYSDLWLSQYQAQPFLHDFLAEHHLTPTFKNPITGYMAHLLRLAIPHRTDADLVVASLVASLPKPVQHADPAFDGYFREHYQTLGLDVRVTNLFVNGSGLTVREDGVYAEDRRVHVVIAEQQTDPDLIEAHRRGKVCLLNPPIGYSLTNKKCLALLSAHADSGIFTEEEAALIARYIPWTRLLVPGEVTYRGTRGTPGDLVRAHKDAFVVKRGEGLGGAQVHLGADTNAADWDRVVAEAEADGHWIVQEALTPLPVLGMGDDRVAQPSHIVWGFFCFGGTYQGSTLRVQEVGKGKINACNGARVSLLVFV